MGSRLMGIALLLLVSAAGLSGGGGSGLPADAAPLLRSALAGGLGGGGGGGALTGAHAELLGRLADVVQNLASDQGGPFWAKLQHAANDGGGGCGGGGNGSAPPGSSAGTAAAAGAAGARPASRRRLQSMYTNSGTNGTALQSDTRRGWCLGGEGDDDSTLTPFKGNFSLEVDDASDLSLLVAHVLATLIEDRLGFEVNLVEKHFIDHSIERVARGDVDASVEIQLTEARDQDIYTQLVEIQELAIDVGPTGYSNHAGWYLANGHVLANEELCTHEDYWHTFTRGAALGAMLTANEVEPGLNATGAAVCDISRGDPLKNGYCPADTGKYFSRACTASGFSASFGAEQAAIPASCTAVASTCVESNVTGSFDGSGSYGAMEACALNLDSSGCEVSFGCAFSAGSGSTACALETDKRSCMSASTAGGCLFDAGRVGTTQRPCKALLAHYPSYDAGVNEQLVNNLGDDGLEIGIVYLGYNASNEIMARASRGEVFLFHHWYPSPLLATGNFTQVFLPTHAPRQWRDPNCTQPDGPISSEFAPATVRKLINSRKSTEFQELKQFLTKFDLHAYHVDDLLRRGVELEVDSSCIGNDLSRDCQTVHEQAACGWLLENTHVWCVGKHARLGGKQSLVPSFQRSYVLCVFVGAFFSLSRCSKCSDVAISRDNFLPDHAHCQVGEHVQVSGDNEEAVCVPCEVGKSMPSRSNLRQCQACAPGTYQNTTGQQFCEQCDAGRYHNYSGTASVNEIDCVACEPGQFQEAESQTECGICNAGKYQPLSGKTFCSSCKTGTYQNESGTISCDSCETDARNCRIMMLNGYPHEECPTAKTNRSEACHCRPGHFKNSTDHCAPCPEGAFCCMCQEIAGCYDPAFGECNLTALHYNMRTYNSTCPARNGEACYSGSPSPMAMPGHYEHNYSSLDEPVFLACNLQVATTKMRTEVAWDYFSCLGGPSSEKPCADDNPQGFLCAGQCAEGSYVASTGRCQQCSDAAFANTLMTSLLAGGFIIGIPLIFTVRHCLCLVFPLHSWLRHCLSLTFHCLCLDHLLQRFRQEREPEHGVPASVG